MLSYSEGKPQTTLSTEIPAISIAQALSDWAKTDYETGSLEPDCRAPTEYQPPLLLTPNEF